MGAGVESVCVWGGIFFYFLQRKDELGMSSQLVSVSTVEFLLMLHCTQWHRQGFREGLAKL